HVQNKDFATLCQSAGTENELHGFSSRHEIADYVRVSDCYWATLRDLLVKKRDHASSAAQDISEADASQADTMAVHEGLHEHFPDAFGSAHDVRRIHRFVGRDEDKALHTSPTRDLKNILSAAHVVEDCFAWMKFHQRDMLVSRGVNDNLRTKSIKDCAQTPGIADVTNKGFNWRTASLPIEPPAPVTKTRLPRYVGPATCSKLLTSTLSRPRTSSTLVSRNWLIWT